MKIICTTQVSEVVIWSWRGWAAWCVFLPDVQFVNGSLWGGIAIFSLCIDARLVLMFAVGCVSILGSSALWLTTHQTLITLQILSIQLLIFNDSVLLLTHSVTDSDPLSL